MRVREHVIRMTRGGGCFLGASLSCADLFVHLYARVLRGVSVRSPDGVCDRLVLAKGRDVPALYATLAELVWGTSVRWPYDLGSERAPLAGLASVDLCASGPAALLARAAEHAAAARHGERVFVMLDNDELDEGAAWEAMLAAGRGLDNLVAMVDCRGAPRARHDLIPLEPVAPTWEAFGWRASRVHGHDFDQLDRAFEAVAVSRGAPSVLFVETIRHKGLPSLEGTPERWFVERTPPEIERLIAELHAAA